MVISKKFLNNGMWLYLLQLFNTIIPLLTLPYVTRILGQEGYGIFSIALNIVIYLQVIIQYGFEFSATREIAISNKDCETISRTCNSIIFVRIILFIISILISLFYLIVTRANSVMCMSMLIMAVSLFGYCIQQNWLFQGMLEMKYISIINIITRATSTILIFAFVKSSNDIIMYSFLYSISPLLSGFAGFLIAKIKYKIHFTKVTIISLKKQLKSGWYIFTTQLSTTIFGAIGITFLGLLSTDEVVGTFSAIQKIPNILLLVWAPISQLLFPIISQQMKNGFIIGCDSVKKYQKIFVPIFLLFALLISIFSNIIIKIAFGDEYAEHSFLVIPLLVWLIIAINNNFLGIQTLLSSGHDKEYSVCFQISVVSTIGLNFILIYLYGGTGAAIAPMLSESVLFVALLYQIRKIKKTLSKEL